MLFFRKKLKKSTDEEDKAFGKMMKEERVGFKDGFAMIISAFAVLVLPCLLILLGLSGLAMLLFGIY